MQQGVIANDPNEKGFGFIKVDGAPDGAKDLFFHKNELLNVQFDDLRKGDRVSFEVGDSPKGPNALKVSKI